MIRCLSLKLERATEILESGKKLPRAVTNKKATQLAWVALKEHLLALSLEIIFEVVLT